MRIKLLRLYVFFMFLMLTLGLMYVVVNQDVSATVGEFISNTIKIDNKTSNGPVLTFADNFGSSVANIGDLNNDGTSDIIVGAYNDDTGGTDTGAIHVLFMNSNGTVYQTVKINNNTLNGPVLSSNDNFGSSVTGIGDLNGDGTSDIIVGAYNDDTGGTDTGAIHVLFMNSNGTVSNTIEINNNTLNGPVLSSNDNFGSSVANIGDLNNDGTSDIIVGAYNDDTGGTDTGAIHVLFMNSNGTVSNTIEINNNTLNGPVLSSNDNFGSSVANIGDLNNDGTSDIAVGAYNDDTGGTDTGAIHVLFMNSNGTVSNTIEINNNTLNGPVLSSNDNFGSSVANIGDLNNDGTSDIAVGAYYDDNDSEGIDFDIGSIHVMFMNSNGTISNTIAIDSNTPSGPVLIFNDNFGSSITNIGDLNNNGTLGIVVGAYGDDTDSVDSGAIYVMFTNVIDTTPPVITLSGANPQTIELEAGYTELGATTNDDSPVTVNSDEFVDVVGTSSIYYDSTDIAGNNATQVIRTVNVVDTTPPVITLIGANPQTIELEAGYTELGATTNDDSPVTVNSDEFVDVVGTSSIYYDSTDIAGNNATQVIRTVNVVDTTPPVITLIGDNPQIIDLGDGYTELGATTNDGSPVTIRSDEFVDKVCSYSIYYDSIDASGNNAFQRIRTVNVVDSTPPPSCIIPGSGNWTINENCMVDFSVTAPRNVLVQNHSTLTVPSGITLDIDFTEFNLTVQYCSGVLVKSGGTIT